MGQGSSRVANWGVAARKNATLTEVLRLSTVKIGFLLVDRAKVVEGAPFAESLFELLKVIAVFKDEANAKAGV